MSPLEKRLGELLTQEREANVRTAIEQEREARAKADFAELCLHEARKHFELPPIGKAQPS